MSNLPWLKLYTEARTDRKLACLTRAEKGVWIDLLMYAADQEARGSFDASDRFTLAMEVADGDEELLNSTLEKLLKVRHIIRYEQHVTSETSGNGGNEYVTAGNSLHSLHRYIFRTFAARQAQKVSNYPSDDKERINERVRKHRALKKQAKLQGSGTNFVTSETSGNDTDREGEGEREYPLSGKDYSYAAVVAPAAAAAVSSNGHKPVQHSGWTDVEARQLAKRISGRFRMTNPDLDGLVAVIQNQPYAPPFLEKEAAKCVEYYDERRRKVTLRLFDNWLAKGEVRQEAERVQQQEHARQQGNGKSNLNGSQQQQQQHQQQSTAGGDNLQRPPDPGDALYQFNVERARSKLVS